jgi:hypothetical protein
MPTESEPTLSTTTVAHLNHALAAIYLVGGIYCISGFFEARR